MNACLIPIPQWQFFNKLSNVAATVQRPAGLHLLQAKKAVAARGLAR